MFRIWCFGYRTPCLLPQCCKLCISLLQISIFSAWKDISKITLNTEGDKFYNKGIYVGTIFLKNVTGSV